jgi:hypothetical protein
MTGDVGIFRVDRGELIVAAVPLAEGVDDGRLVISSYDHDPYWPIVQRTHDIARFRILTCAEGGCY